MDCAISLARDFFTNGNAGITQVAEIVLFGTFVASPGTQGGLGQVKSSGANRRESDSMRF
jgi:hypothetical protein